MRRAGADLLQLQKQGERVLCCARAGEAPRYREQDGRKPQLPRILSATMPSDASENQTIVESWSISALKAYLENKITSVERETELKFQARDEALRLQFNADQLHFDRLNHEAARIQKATEITVSRDTWEAFQEADRTWKAKIERELLAALPRAEFSLYKETTEKALNVGAGKWQGALQLISTGASIAAIAGVAIVMLR